MLGADKDTASTELIYFSLIYRPPHEVADTGAENSEAHIMLYANNTTGDAFENRELIYYCTSGWGLAVILVRLVNAVGVSTRRGCVV